MSHNTLTTLDQLWEAAVPRPSDEEQRIGIAVLRELSKGEPVDPTRLEQALGTRTGKVEAVLRSSVLKPFVYWGEDGRVEGLFGLAIGPMHHRFTIDGRTLWTWCALDSLFLPELLGETARASGSLSHPNASRRLSRRTWCSR